MVTNAQAPEEEPTKENVVRYAIAGHEYGSVRRIILYALVAVCIAVGFEAGALAALFILALTDQLA